MFRAQGVAPRQAADTLRQGIGEDVRRANEAGHERRARAEIEFVRGIHLLDTAIIEPRHPIRHRQGFALVVGHENKGDAQLLLQFFQFKLHLLPQFQVQRPEGFIQQQNPGLIDQRPGYRNPLTLAARQLRGFAGFRKA